MEETFQIKSILHLVHGKEIRYVCMAVPGDIPKLALNELAHILLTG